MITVLVADNHAVVRDGLRALIEGQPDMRVIGVASTGREAIEQAKVTRPDVALIDISMPELNGIDATRRISEDCPSTRNVILSMHSAPQLVVEAVRWKYSSTGGIRLQHGHNHG